MIVVTSLALITLDERGSGVIDSARRAAHDAVAPVQHLADDAVRPVSDFFDSIGRAGSLDTENKKLRRELAAALAAGARGKVAEARIEALEQLLDLPRVADTGAVAARVVDYSTGNFERTFEIDRGTDDGVRQGMPVVVGASGGVLVGQVVVASKTRATVRRVDDRRFVVGVRLVEANSLGELGIAQGQADSNLLRVSLQSQTAALKKGQLAVTTGLDIEPYPPELLVGEIARSTSAGASTSNEALLRPIVDLDRLDVVKVLPVHTASTP